MINLNSFAAPSRLSWSDEQPLVALTQELALAQASALAYAGRYAEAEQRLRPLLDDHTLPVAALDLLARIQAQQGRLQEAEAYWRQAQQSDTQNTTYAAGLRRVAYLRQRAVRWLYLAPLMLTAVGAFLFIFVLWVIVA